MYGRIEIVEDRAGVEVDENDVVELGDEVTEVESVGEEECVEDAV